MIAAIKRDLGLRVRIALTQIQLHLRLGTSLVKQSSFGAIPGITWNHAAKFGGFCHAGAGIDDWMQEMLQDRPNPEAPPLAPAAGVKCAS